MKGTACVLLFLICAFRLYSQEKVHEKIILLEFDSAHYYLDRLPVNSKTESLGQLIEVWKNSGGNFKADSSLAALISDGTVDPLKLILKGSFFMFYGDRGSALKYFLNSIDLIPEGDSDLAFINSMAILNIYSKTLLLGNDFARHLYRARTLAKDSKAKMAWYHIYKMKYNGRLPPSDTLEFVYKSGYEDASRFFETYDLTEQILAFYQYQKGSFHKAYDQFEVAEISFLEAIQYAKNHPYLRYELFNSYIQLAGIKSKQGEFDLAKEYLDLARRNQFKYDITLTDLNYHWTLSLEYYENTKQWDSAYFKLKNTMGPTFQLFIEENNIHVNELAQKYEVDKKENEIQLQKDRITNQNRILWIVGISVICLLILSAVLVYAFSNIQKKNRKIETLMRELHHRVKNNLQVISSLLGLQSMKLEDEAAKKAVSEGKGRIRAMSLIHQKLYQNEEVTSLNIREYISSLVDELTQSYGFQGKTKILIEAPEDIFDADTSLPLGLIINELVSNAFKYAFKDIKEPILGLRLIHEDPNEFSLHIEDNGHGLPHDFNVENATSFGMKLVHLLVRQLGGTIDIENDNGLHCHIRFQLV